MMELVARQEIQYWFGYICKDLTDKMITIFNELLKETSGHKLMISQFEAVNPAKVVNRVFDSVVHSINATTMTLTGRRCPIRSYSIDKSNPNWGTLKEHLATYLSMTPIPEETEDEEGTIASRPRTATLLVADSACNGIGIYHKFRQCYLSCLLLQNNIQSWYVCSNHHEYHIWFPFLAGLVIFYGVDY